MAEKKRVVTPDNMGKGLIYNNPSKTYRIPSGADMLSTHLRQVKPMTEVIKGTTDIVFNNKLSVQFTQNQDINIPTLEGNDKVVLQPVLRNYVLKLIITSNADKIAEIRLPEYSDFTITKVSDGAYEIRCSRLHTGITYETLLGFVLNKDVMELGKTYKVDVNLHVEYSPNTLNGEVVSHFSYVDRSFSFNVSKFETTGSSFNAKPTVDFYMPNLVLNEPVPGNT